MAVTQVVCMAAAVALAILVLVLGCVMDDVWWSMFTTVAYLCAAIGWALTQPGFICGQQQGAAFGNTREGMCGGDLFPLWGCFFTAFFGFSSFGASTVMWRSDVIQDSFYSSNLAGVILVVALLYEVKEGAISRTNSRHRPLTAGV